MNASMILGAILTVLWAFAVGHKLAPMISSKEQIWLVYNQEIVVALLKMWITLSGVMYLLVGRYQARGLRRLGKIKEQFEAGKLEVKR